MDLLKKAGMKATTFFFVILLFTLGFQLSLAESSKIIYVNYHASGNDDGTSWSDAFVDLQDALAEAEEGDEIWVAAGTYYPAVYEAVYAPEIDRSATFQLVSGMALYGGFAGGETSLEDRDWETNVTVLSGDLERNDTTDAIGVVADPDNIVGDNAYHVVTTSGTGAGTILDGFTITAGDASGTTWTEQEGGGMRAASTAQMEISNIVFKGNRAESYGGGLSSFFSTAVLNNVVFRNNYANFGGGLFLRGASDLTINDTLFMENTAETNGGGLADDSSIFTTLVLARVEFINNQAGANGGGMCLNRCTLSMERVNFTNNEADKGGGLHYSNSTGTYNNLLFTGNQAQDGGGLYQVSSTNTFHNVNFISNQANEKGGGVYSSYGESFIINSSFRGNSASGDGGGIYNFRHDMDLVNVVFSGNNVPRVNGGGGGIYNEDGSTLLVNNTFSGNHADLGGAIRNVTGNRSILVNCILWGNSGAPISIPLGNPPTQISFSLVEGSGGSGDGWQTSLGEDLGGNLDADPLFVQMPDWENAPFTHGDYRLQSLSPAINAGTNEPFDEGGAAEDVKVDLDGNPRIMDSVVNMGPYELIATDDLGILHVTMEPEAARDAGAAWSVTGGTIWYESGAEVNLPVGSYTVTFKELAGWDEPGSIQVVVELDSLTTESGTYVIQPMETGTLAVTIEPEEARTAGAQWSIDGGDTWQDSGAELTLQEGAYTVNFKEITGWDEPTSVLVQVTEGGEHEETGVYTRNTGTLTVTIEPEEARSAGARWSIDGGDTWQDSERELILLAGTYELIFSEIDNLFAPPDATVTISEGLPTSYSGLYRETIIYVKQGAAGANDGTSWSDAYSDLQSALDAVREGMEIWVAAGVYVPSQRLGTDDPRSATFQLRNDVSIYGGFAGGEINLAQRDWEANITVLSGDLEGDDITDEYGTVTNPDNIVGENAYTVVCNDEIDATAVLDGFVITAGKSDVVDHTIIGSSSGGGIYNLQSSPTLSNLVITGCYAPEDSPVSKTGGGMMNAWNSHPTLTNVTLKSNHGRAMVNSYSNPTLTDVVFENNTMGGVRNYYSSPTLTDVHFISNGDFWAETPGYGGGMHNGSQSSPSLTNVTFRGNYVRWHGGGMFNSQNSNPTLINVLFSGNASGRSGGGMTNSAASSPTLINTSFSGNYAWYQGGALSNLGSSHPSLINSIFWHNHANVYWQITSEIYNEGDQYGEQYICYPEFSHSIVKGSGGSGSWDAYFGVDGGNNLDVDPQFVNQPQFSNAGHTGGNLRLQEGSPAISAGINSPFEVGGDAFGVNTDLEGSPRIQNAVVDMGPFECQDVTETEAAVSTPAELDAALRNVTVSTIRFQNNITAEITADRLVNLDFRSYSLNGNVQFDTFAAGSMVFDGSATPAITGNLTVDTPNATVTNNVNVGGTVKIKDVAGSTWIENADGNDLVIDLQNGTATIIINGSINSLTVNGSGDELNIVINGSVATAVFNAPASVTGAGSITSAYIAPGVGLDLDEEPQGYLYKLSLQASPVEGGTVAGDGYYAEAEGVSISAQPNTGYRFVSWSFSRGTVDNTDAPETIFTMPARDVTVTANFAAVVSERPSAGGGVGGITPRYNLTLIMEGDGTVQPLPGKHTYRKDTVVNLEAAAAEGWAFEKWLGPVKDAESSATTVTVDQDLEVAAVFREVVMELEPTDIMLRIGTTKVLIPDEEEFQMDVAPFIEHDRTFVPVRFVAEIFGAAADWTPKEGLTEVVTLTKGDTFVTIKIGSPVITIREGGVTRTVTADVVSQIVDDRTFLPLRAVGEIFGASFDWGPKEARTAWVSFTFFSKPD